MGVSVMKSEIVLVNPRDGAMPYDYYATYENLGIAYLTGSLRKAGFDASIVDGYAKNLSSSEMFEEIKVYDPKIVSFTCTYLSYPEAVDTAVLLKEWKPEIIVLIGGEHATYAADAVLNESAGFDIIMFGEGEMTVVELVEKLLKNEPYDKVAGIGYKNANGEVVRNAFRQPVTNIDELAFPARDTLDYCIDSNKPGLIGMLASRGCAFNCSFCNANEYFNLGHKPRLRRRSPENVVDELENIYTNYYDKGLYELIYFYDATFVYPNEESRVWVKEFCEEIIKRDIHVSFEVNCRADSFKGSDDPLIPLLKKAGLKSVFVGLESGAEDVLEKYNKKTTTNQNVAVMNILKEHGIQSTTNGFIMFNPYINPQGLKESADLLLEVGQCTFWNLSQKVQLFPGIQMIEDLRNEGLLDENYKHDLVYGYKFQDPKVQLLSDVLDFSQEEAPTRENHTVRYIDMMVEQLMEMLKRADELDAVDLNEIQVKKDSIVEKRLNLAKLNRDFFVETIDVAIEEWNQDKFEKMKAEYLLALDKNITILCRQYEEFVDYIDKAV